MDNQVQKQRDTNLRRTSRSLPIALLRAREAVMAPVREMLAEAGVTEQQWRVLRVLEEIGPAGVSRVAREASLLPPSLTRIAQTLADKGLVTRAASGSDGRRSELAISVEGQALLTRHADEARRIAADLEARFGADRLEQLLDLLNDLNALERRG